MNICLLSFAVDFSQRTEGNSEIWALAQIAVAKAILFFRHSIRLLKQTAKDKSLLNMIFIVNFLSSNNYCRATHHDYASVRRAVALSGSRFAANQHCS